MRRVGLMVAAILISQALGGALAHAGTTWYVSASAGSGGDGSIAAPFNSLASVEHASAPGDSIVVVASPLAVPPLDGGIALKHDQRLIGGGPSVIDNSGLTSAPRITNKTGATHSGDAVDLANGAEVSNLVISGAFRGSIYGLDVTGVNVHDNDVSAFNTSCTNGFEIQPIVAPSDVPGVGIPFGVRVPVLGNVYALDIIDGWAGIMIDATNAAGDARIENNRVHDGTCGDGIDVRLSGTADLSAEVIGNQVTRLAQGHFTAPRPSVEVDSLVAIGMQTDNYSRLASMVDRNTETYIGSGTASDCDTLFADLSGSSVLSELIDHNTFAHGIGGTSCNGMEMVTGNGSPVADMRIANSSFNDNPGDMLEAGNLGVNSKMRLVLDNDLIENTTIRGGNSGAIPFNIGDCLLAGDSGSGDVTEVRVLNSEIKGCNNAISFASNAVAGNGVGPDGSMSLDIENSKIHDASYYDLWVQNASLLDTLSVKVQNSAFWNAGQTTVAFDQKPTAMTLHPTIDLGGGSLGSAGGNCISGGAQYDAETTGFTVSAINSWWGSATGPAPSKTSASPPVTSGLTIAPWLETPPPICS